MKQTKTKEKKQHLLSEQSAPPAAAASAYGLSGLSDRDARIRPSASHFGAALHSCCIVNTLLLVHSHRQMMRGRAHIKAFGAMGLDAPVPQG